MPVPSSEGHAREQGPPVCWCRAAAPGLLGVGEWGPREGRCPWWVLVTAPCPSALPCFGQHRCVSAASVLESLTGSLRGSAEHRAGSCPGRPHAPGSAKIMLAAGADLGVPGRQCHCQSRQRGQGLRQQLSQAVTDFTAARTGLLPSVVSSSSVVERTQKN